MALSVSPRTSIRSGRYSSISPEVSASTRPTRSAKLPPAMPRWRSGSRTPSPSKKTSLRHGSKFCPVWTRTSSQARSRRSITQLRRMISGRVPRTVRTLIGAGRLLADHSVTSKERAHRLRVDQVLGRAVLPPTERIALAPSGSRSSGRIGAITKYPLRASVRRRLLLGDQDLVHLLAGANPDPFDLDLPIGHQRLGDVHQPRGRRSRDVGLSRRARRESPRRPCRPPGRG